MRKLIAASISLVFSFILFTVPCSEVCAIDNSFVEADSPCCCCCESLDECPCCDYDDTNLAANGHAHMIYLLPEGLFCQSTQKEFSSAFNNDYFIFTDISYFIFRPPKA